MATSRKLYPVDLERSWDAAQAVARMRDYATRDGEVDWELVHTFFLWYDDRDPEKWTSHKLPVVDIVDGVPRAIWRAIVNARARLNQTDIPESDKREVLAQIKRYYRKAGKEFEEAGSPPEMLPMFISPTSVSQSHQATLADRVGALYVNGVLFGEHYDALVRRLRSLGSGDVVWLVLDSPGGAASGALSAALELQSAVQRGARIYVYTRRQLSSAAYLIASGASAIYAAPDALIGSIGAIAAVFSVRGELEQRGVDVAVLRSAPQKALPTPFDALSEEARASIQAIVDAYGSQFVNFVRGARVVAEEAFSGAEFLAPEALKLGLIDGILTYGEMERVLEETTALRERLDALAQEVSALRKEREELMAKLEVFLRGSAVNDEIDRAERVFEQKVFEVLGLN